MVATPRKKAELILAAHRAGEARRIVANQHELIASVLDLMSAFVGEITECDIRGNDVSFPWVRATVAVFRRRLHVNCLSAI